MRRVLEGTSGSRGMALGRARLEHPGPIAADERPLPDNEVDAEIERLDQAIEIARAELAELRDRLHGALAREVGEFLDAHRMLLDDPDLKRALHRAIRQKHMRASQALRKQRDRLVSIFDAMDDPYLRARREDVDQVIARVQSALARPTSREERKLAARVGEILVADSIPPAEMAHLAGHGLLGLVTTGGSSYSHSSILARSLRLPMVLGVEEALSDIADEDLILVDGESGQVVIHPTAQDLARYRTWQRETAAEGRRLAGLAAAPSVTADKQQVSIYANAELPAEIAEAHRLGAAGIGLYRTEFLFLHRDTLPDEETQFEAYRQLVLGMGGLPVTIRTLDLGADKAGSAGLSLPAEDNPALGVRGLRLSLRRPAVFTAQLRAILRAACYGPVRILLPMVTVTEEIASTRTLLELCLRDLRSENQPVPEKVELGAMIEVPAAALGIQSLLEVVDFVAIGTNDLAQYVLAVDRNHDGLEKLYDPLQPALLRLIAHVITSAKRAGKPVSLCGEMAGDPNFTPLLLALGLEQFSMHPQQILAVRDALTSCNSAALRKLAPRILHAANRDEVEALLNEATVTERSASSKYKP